MTRAVLAAMLLAAAAPLAAAQGPEVSRETIPAPAQPGAVPLPFAAGAPDGEIWHMDGSLRAVRNVTRPTLTPFLPTHGATGAAVIVAPGGGFLGLAIEKEGWQVARWLANHGIAAFVLKYRVLPTPVSQPAFAEQLGTVVRGGKASFAVPDDTPDAAFADGLVALRLVRAKAHVYGVDPNRVGFMGFSAGGFLTRSLVERGGADAPAFAAPIYPNMTALRVPADAPPMFVAVAADDFLLARVTGAPLVDSYRAAKRSIEFHLFASGGHGFGMGIDGTPTEGWMDQYLRWLGAQGFLKGTQ